MTPHAALGSALVAALLAGAPSAAAAAEPAATTAPATTEAEAREAAALYDAGNALGALPLYERLTARVPEDVRYAERAAICLMTAVQTMPPGAERARALGDTSSLLQVVFEHVAEPLPVGAAIIADPMMAQAETAFARGDFDAALALYLRIAEANPRDYDARLYAGDVYFKRDDLARAAEWYGKAVAIDPDRETAHRYWGDALARHGQAGAAYGHLLDAIVAEPYSRRAWAGLAQWAKALHIEIKPPTIPAPRDSVDVDDKGGMMISVDPKSLAHSGAAWLAYSASRGLWRQSKFKEAYPSEATYRHSLAEEVTALKMARVVAGGEAGHTKDYGDLARLDDDGMLEPYVLVSAPDAGIAKDYAAYRAAHRDQLRSYLDRYVVRRLP